MSTDVAVSGAVGRGTGSGQREGMIGESPLPLLHSLAKLSPSRFPPTAGELATPDSSPLLGACFTLPLEPGRSLSGRRE